MTGAALILQGDALHLPLPDASVDLVVTSPPYWALRAYGAGPGEIGSEPTPQAFLEALWAATAEMMRVLKPTGSMFVDLGDKYSANASSNGGGTTLNGGRTAPIYRPGQGQGLPGAPPKSLMLLPERYRVGCVDRLGLIARAVLVWNKPNGLPESVTDRVRRSHEDWVHLTKQPRYYSATDEVREPHTPASLKRYATPFAADSTSAGKHRPSVNADYSGQIDANPLGKLPGSVWSIASEPLRLPEHLGVQHYAAFPSEWPRRLILGWSPPGICLECGQGRVPVVESLRRVVDPGKAEKRLKAAEGAIKGTSKWSTLSDEKGAPSATILGYACSCTPFTDHPGGVGTLPRTGPWREYHLDGWRAPPTRPAVVLDPFGGTGTTVMVARALGRIGVGVDLSRPYCRAARWRVRHDAGKAISRTNLERQGSLL